MTTGIRIRFCADCRNDCTHDGHLMPGANGRFLVRCSRCRARVEREGKG